MMILKEHRHVFIAVPRTASRSTYTWLARYYGGATVGSYHQWRVPDHYKDFTIFIGVRNPYERCFSFYWWTCKEPPKGGKPLRADFATYMEHLIETKYGKGKENNKVPEIHGSMKNYYDNSGASVFIRLEHFQKDVMKKLPFVKGTPPAMPRKHGCRNKPQRRFTEVIRAREEQLVWDYCKEDFDFFGYKRLALS